MAVFSRYFISSTLSFSRVNAAAVVSKADLKKGLSFCFGQQVRERSTRLLKLSSCLRCYNQQRGCCYTNQASSITTLPPAAISCCPRAAAQKAPEDGLLLHRGDGWKSAPASSTIFPITITAGWRNTGKAPRRTARLRTPQSRNAAAPLRLQAG